MEKQSKPGLEEAIHRELKALPQLKAPSNLLPSVMAAIQARANLPWYRKSWQKWPRGLQLLSLGLGLVMVSAITGSAGWAWQTWVSEPLSRLTTLASAELLSIWSVLQAFAGAMALAAKSMSSTVWITLGCLVAVSYAVCIGTGAFVYHFVRERE